MAVRLIVRDSPTGQWIQNFDKLGWKLRNDANTAWIQMHPANTKVRSSDNTRWLNVK